MEMFLETQPWDRRSDESKHARALQRREGLVSFPGRTRREKPLPNRQSAFLPNNSAVGAIDSEDKRLWRQAGHRGGRSEPGAAECDTFTVSAASVVCSRWY